MSFLSLVMAIGIGVNLFTILIELTTTHPTQDAKYVVKMITKGRYRQAFWFGAIAVGNLLPLVFILFAADNPMMIIAASALVLIGIYFTEKIWVEAPQRIALS
jgi:hypothetical protein